MTYPYDEFETAYEYEPGNDMTKTLVTGLVIGGLIGAAVMLFMAPESGKKTLRKLQKRTMKLRENAMDTVEDAMKQARHRAGKVSAGVRKQTNRLTDRSHDLLDEQRSRVTDAVQEGRKRIHLPGR
jgi:gas vesicle protein